MVAEADSKDAQKAGMMPCGLWERLRVEQRAECGQKVNEGGRVEEEWEKMLPDREERSEPALDCA